MADWIGQNPDEVNDLAATFDAKAGDLEAVVQTITSKLAGTTWQGPDRVRFETSDWTTIQTGLNQAAQALRDAGNIARNNATEQTTASA